MPDVQGPPVAEDESSSEVDPNPPGEDVMDSITLKNWFHACYGTPGVRIGEETPSSDGWWQWGLGLFTRSKWTQ